MRGAAAVGILWATWCKTAASAASPTPAPHAGGDDDLGTNDAPLKEKVALLAVGGVAVVGMFLWCQFGKRGGSDEEDDALRRPINVDAMHNQGPTPVSVHGGDVGGAAV